MVTDPHVERKIFSRAPTRIDLAGGTIDIWPIYLFIKDAATVNLGINLFAEATLAESRAKQPHGENTVHLRSEDQGKEIKLPWSLIHSSEAIPNSHVPRELELHVKLLRHYARHRSQRGKSDSNMNLSLVTLGRSPAGAGLGGSSSLCIAIAGALSAWADEGQGEHLVEIARDVETTVIGVPAGLQDYYAALGGGLQCLHWGTGTHHQERMDDLFLSKIEDRILLFYSGQSRNSGINNWALFKSLIDRKDGVAAKFEGINSATHSLKKAIQNQDWQGAGQAIAKEWEIRKTLASEISTPEMDCALLEAKKAASFTGKVCGAGGGGCFFVFLPNAGKKDALIKSFESAGMRHLPFRASKEGLEVRVSRA